MCFSQPKAPPPPPVPAPPATEVNASQATLRERAPQAPAAATSTPLSVSKKRGKAALKVELDQSNLMSGGTGVNIP
jgi:hypothetical protein